MIYGTLFPTEQVRLPLSTKLSTFRDQLSRQDSFGVPAEQQRIFYMGRELKSGSRSLVSLGLGNFDFRILHLHVRPAESSARSDTVLLAPVRKRRRIEAGSETTRSHGSLWLSSNHSSSGNAINNSRREPATSTNSEVVDLLDSSSDEEEARRTEEDEGDGTNSSNSSYIRNFLVLADSVEEGEDDKNAMHMFEADSNEEEEDGVQENRSSAAHKNRQETNLTNPTNNTEGEVEVVEGS